MRKKFRILFLLALMIHGFAIVRIPAKEFLAFQRGDKDPAVKLNERYSPIAPHLPEKGAIGHLVTSDLDPKGKNDIPKHHRHFMLKYVLAPRSMMVIRDRDATGDSIPPWQGDGAPETIIFEGKPGHAIMRDYPDITPLGEDLFLLRRSHD